MKPLSCTLALLLLTLTLTSTPLEVSALPGETSADGSWTEIRNLEIPLGPGRVHSAADYGTTYRLDQAVLRAVLLSAPLEFSAEAATDRPLVALPLPDGSYEHFLVVESPVLTPELAEEHPDIRTFLGQGVEDGTASTRLTLTSDGLNAVILKPGEIVSIEPYRQGDPIHYVSYYTKDLPIEGGFDCQVLGRAPQFPAGRAAPSGDQLSTYELGISATGEYTIWAGGAGPAMNQITASVTALNAIYEAEVAVRFMLACTSIATDPDNDAFTDPETVDGTLLDENDDNLDDVCGSDGYDVGHLVHRRSSGGFSGLADFGVVCGGSKGRGASSDGDPSTNFFVVNQLAHEVGHQFAADHNFDGTGGRCGPNRSAGHNYEIGSGSTTMCYGAGGCGSDNIGTIDGYFHTHSFDQITNFRDGTACSAVGTTGNGIPTVDAGPDYTIPRGTPFTLTATGSDPDGDTVTYCWEQFDNGEQPENDQTEPLFRSFPPTTSSSRTFPRLNALLNGTATPFEILPTVDRPMNFRATIRDNRAGGGGVNNDGMLVTVSGDPFFVTAPNGGELLPAGCQTDVTWVVGGGSVAPNVSVLISTDGGASFDVLLASTPNDGSATVTMPCVDTSQARILVQAVDNVFFDVGDGNFTIDIVAPTVAVTAQDANVNDDCVAFVSFSATITDDCAVGAANVDVTASVITSNANVDDVTFTPVQTSGDVVNVTGVVTVSGVTSCPATVRVQVTGTDDCGATTSQTDDADVNDLIPPEIEVELNQYVLWPPNHKMVDIEAAVTATDNCSVVSFVLTSITSDEPDEGLGDGDFPNDIQGATPGTPDVEFQLRAERSGLGDGRVYTIVYTATDGCGNSTDDTVEVIVPHDRRGGALASQGFASTGLGLDDWADQFALVVVSGPDPDGSGFFDVHDVVSSECYVGNTAGSIRPLAATIGDVDLDGIDDLAVFYDVAATLAIAALSDAVDGPVALHYHTASGEHYLVPDIFALGAPVELPGGMATGVDELASVGAALATVTALSGIHPNPFGRSTTVEFALDRDGEVSISVFDARGARVKTLAAGARASGYHRVDWNGRDDLGRRLASGVYFVQLRAAGVESTRKVVLLQ